MAEDEKTPGDKVSDDAGGGKEAPVTPPPEEPKTAKKPKKKDAEAAEPARGKRKGVVGAVLVAVAIVLAGQAILFIYNGGVVGIFSPDRSAETQRIAALEEKLAALEAAEQENAAATRSLANDIETRDDEITALSNSVSQLAEGGGEAIGSDLETAKAMIGALEERLDLFEAETGERDPMLGGDVNAGQQAQASGDVTEMREALDTLNQRFAAMNQSLDEAGGRIEALEDVAPPENLGELLDNLNSRNELEGLAARLAAIEAADPEGAARAAVLALAATELARAAATSQPFVTELEAFAALAPDNAFVARLQPFAEKGTAMEKALLLEFEPARKAMTKAALEREGGGLWNMFLNWLTEQFRITKVGERDGDDWQSILARAENRIAIEDTAAAADELAKLTGPAAEGAAPWLGRVRARQQVDSAVTGLTAQVFSDLLGALESE